MQSPNKLPGHVVEARPVVPVVVLEGEAQEPPEPDGGEGGRGEGAAGVGAAPDIGQGAFHQQRPMLAICSHHHNNT